MAPKYTKGQQVTIRSVKTQHYQSKYPELEQYVREAGTIVETYGIGTSEPYHLEGEGPHPSDDYLYRVQLHMQNKLVAVPEEALELLDSED